MEFYEKQVRLIEPFSASPLRSTIPTPTQSEGKTIIFLLSFCIIIGLLYVKMFLWENLIKR